MAAIIEFIFSDARGYLSAFLTLSKAKSLWKRDSNSRAMANGSVLVRLDSANNLSSPSKSSAMCPTSVMF